jgi:hypothetical protein
MRSLGAIAAATDEIAALSLLVRPGSSVTLPKASSQTTASGTAAGGAIRRAGVQQPAVCETAAQRRAMLGFGEIQG